jgi:hypothetical protein
MISISIPERVEREAVLRFLESLGVEINDTRSLLIDPSGVHLELLARDGEGKHYSGPDCTLAVHTVSIRWVDE